MVAKSIEHELLKLAPDYRTECFTSAVLFLYSVENGSCFDVVLMDIDWGQKLTGMDFAEKLMKLSPETQVIFVTGYGEQYSQRIFLNHVNLCGFLVKPVDPLILTVLLHKAESRRRSMQSEKMLIRSKGVTTSIPYSEIFYFENEGRKTLVFSLHGNSVVNERLEDIRRTFPSYFMNCHKSFTVNMNEIRRFEKSSIILTDGSEIPVSKARYAEAREQYFRYIGQSMA